VEQERVLARVQVLVWEQEQVLALAAPAVLAVVVVEAVVEAVAAVKYPSQ
jgi:hypothetical protein